MTINQKIRTFYGLNRPVTDAEVAAEVDMLKRRGPYDCDDRQLALAAMLQTGDNPIDIF